VDWLGKTNNVRLNRPILAQIAFQTPRAASPWLTHRQRPPLGVLLLSWLALHNRLSMFPFPAAKSEMPPMSWKLGGCSEVGGHVGSFEMKLVNQGPASATWSGSPRRYAARPSPGARSGRVRNIPDPVCQDTRSPTEAFLRAWPWSLYFLRCRQRRLPGQRTNTLSTVNGWIIARNASPMTPSCQIQPGNDTTAMLPCCPPLIQRPV
jgi:hypothetical protein